MPAQSSVLGLALGAGLLALVASEPAAAFGGVAGLAECTSFATCTAVAGGSTHAFAQYTFTAVTPGYRLPVAFVPGANTFQDTDDRQTTAPLSAAVGGFCANCYSDNPFFSSASGRSQSDFGRNRGSAATSFGAAGSDVQMFGQIELGSAGVRVLTVADASSGWRDVWSFDTDGHFSATIAIDGHSSTAIGNVFFPSTYGHVPGPLLGEWFYDLDIWDVTNLSASEDFELGGPTLVARVRDRTGNSGEARPTFASSLALEFDFVAGASYVVTSELGVHARNGRDIDLYDTALLTDVALSHDATLSTLSGHDYLAAVAPPVPEPGIAGLLLGGLACMSLWARRRGRRTA